MSVKIAPGPELFRTSTLPRCASMIVFTMARPRPIPSVSTSLPLQNRSNIRSRWSMGTPGPWSATFTRPSACDAHPFGATVDELAEIWVQLGHALKELRDVPGAENAYRSAVAMNGRNLGDAHFQLSSLLLAQGNSSEAASCFFSTMKLDPVLAGRAREALLYLDYTASDIDDACRSQPILRVARLGGPELVLLPPSRHTSVFVICLI